MAGFSAGVHTEADLNAQPAPKSKATLMFGDAGTWSYVWVAIAFLYLVGIYIGMFKVARR